MAEIIISVVAKIGEYLVGPVKRHGRYLLCVDKFIKSLENGKKELTSKRDSVQKRVEEAKKKTEKIENAVEKWLSEVKDLLEEVEKLEQEARSNNSCFRGWCPNWRRYHLCKQIEKKTKVMTELNVNCKFEQFSRLASLPKIEYFSSGNFTFFVSTKLAYNKLLEALQDDSTYMIGLYGMGGSGKTTLVKEVGKRVKELKYFDQVVFTTVSQTPNVMRVQDEIADLLGLKLDEKTEAGRARRISLRLQSGERILIILDDVWTKLNFEDIGIPFGSNFKGCKVLLTTRRQQICSIMDCQRKILLDLLSEEETWTLFQKLAGIDNDNFLFLHNVAREVAWECKGLPIAIEAVGTSLKGKSIDEWKVALKRLRDSKPVDVEEGVPDAFSCLQLSYNYLRSRQAKSLLLMCSMFPENHEIFIEDLFRYGIGLGLCGEVSSFEVARSEVNAAINNLIDSCLLMHSDKRNNHLKMHDMIRDVALWIASKEDYPIVVNSAINSSALAENASIKKCFALSSWYKKIDQFPDQLNAPKLEILLLDNTSSMQLSSSSFKSMKALKVVAMISQYYYMGHFTLLLQSIQFLTNLRILRLVRWELGDISLVVNLRKLEILDLRGSCFKELPNGIENLDKLKMLDLSWCGVEVSCYKVLRRCSQLQELYVLGDSYGIINACECLKDDITFTELQSFVLQIGQFKSSLDLDDLSRRVLKIGDFNPIASGAFIKYLLQRAGDVSFYKLCGGGCESIVPCTVQAVGGMKELTRLLLRSCSEVECLIDTTSDDVLFKVDTVFPRLVKLQLELMNNLKEVCHGPPLPCFFEKLEELHLWRCLELHSLFSGDWNLFNLKIVSICNCPRLTSLFQMSAAQTLQQLEELTIAECSELMNIIINAESGNSTGEEISPIQDNSPLMFPKLKILSVCSCNKLECTFPISCVQSLKKLQCISIVQAPELKYIFGQHDHGDHLSLQNEIHTEFPLLEVLKLQGLTNLLGICPTNYQMRFPSLREEYCVNCPKLTKFGLAPRQLHLNMDGTNDSQSSVEVAILSQLLEGIKNMTNLQGERQEIMVSGISQLIEHVQNSKAENIHLQIDGLDKEQQEAMALAEEKLRSGTLSEPTDILSLRFQHLPHISVLEVNDYKTCKSLFSPRIYKSLSELRQLVISDCEELEVIIAEHEEPQTEVCFPKLSDLRVLRCNKLKHLFSATLSIKFPQLNSIYISEAAELEEVFRQRSEGITNNSKEIVLPNLREIKLKKLPCLVNFCQGFMLYTLELHKVLIHECPKLDPSIASAQVISLDQRTEELQSPVTNDVQVCNEDSTLLAASNAIKQLPTNEEKEKIMISSVEWLYLKHLPDLLFVWISFQNIYFLKVSGCRKLKSIFPSTVTRSLPQLSFLDVGDCDELEEIILDPDFEEQRYGNPSSNIRPQKVCFPNLTNLIVQRCSNLKCLFSVTKKASVGTHDGEVIEFVLPKLEDLTLKNLPSIVDICGGFQYQFQLQLQVLESYNVEHCPNFSSTTIATLDNFWRARQSRNTDDEAKEEVDDDFDFFDEYEVDSEEEESEENDGDEEDEDSDEEEESEENDADKEDEDSNEEE